MLAVDGDRWQEGMFVFLHPAENRHCAEAVARYRGFLQRPETFAVLILESAVEGLSEATDAGWVHALKERYLGEASRRACS